MKNTIIRITVILLISITGTFYWVSNSKYEIEEIKSENTNEVNEEVSLGSDNETLISEETIEDEVLILEETSNTKETKIENQKQEKIETSTKEEATKKQVETKSSNTTSVNKEASTNKVNENNSSKENKKLSKSEIEEYLKKNVSDFRYDFDTIKECQVEGDKWAEYGWVYNCPTVSVPNSDIKPVMLVISTGKFFCDGKYTKNEKYDWKKPKISSISYLREIGYPCENIEGTN